VLDFLSDPQFWTGLGQIILINIVLSGDNAVVIALAARSLPPRRQKQAIFWGSGAAVVMRIILTVIAVELLRSPYLKIVGGVLLVWIARLGRPRRGPAQPGARSAREVTAGLRSRLKKGATHQRGRIVGLF